MTARILDGKTIAASIELEILRAAREFSLATGQQATLAAVLVGEDPASQVYVRKKRNACRRLGLQSRLLRLPAGTAEKELVGLIGELNHDPSVHGILVQLPLPGPLDSVAVIEAIAPEKDVDGFHAVNVGLLMQGRPRFIPCTPQGVLQILFRSQLPVAGQHVCVIGRSDIVGKPLAAMLMQRECGLGPDYANATVTVCHSQTRGLAEITRTADVVVAAIGRAGFVTADMIRPGATVIDVGINRIGERLVGDVAFESVCQVAGAITPVPGGVGPLTVTMLMANTLQAAREQTSKCTGRISSQEREPAA